MNNADLTDASLACTTLSRAQLRNAKLSGTSFGSVDLRAAALAGAELSETTRFAQVLCDKLTTWPKNFAPAEHGISCDTDARALEKHRERCRRCSFE